jgi:uncharacterized protein (DUF1919 family)
MCNFVKNIFLSILENNYLFIEMRINAKVNCFVTNNCYGLKYYSLRKIQYNTCFIGLFIFAPCYIKLLENFDNIMKLPLTKSAKSKYLNNPVYPVGFLDDDIEIHFMHYKSFKEARDKWNRRKQRMLDIEECTIKMDDRDGYTEEIGKRFVNLPYENKLLFLSRKNFFPSKYVIKTHYKNMCPDGKKLEEDYTLF